MNFKNKHNENNSVKNLHEGHRQRLRERMLQTNFVKADDYQILEYLLTLVVKRKDTNELAHRLINTFGSFSNVCDSEIEDLQKVEGITYSIAYFLHIVPYIFRNYKISKKEPKAILNCAQDIFNYLGQAIFHLPIEEFYIICLDNANKVIAQKMLSAGKSTTVAVDLDECVQYAIKTKAKKVVLLHNHPTSEPDPSFEDIETTKNLFLRFASTGIELYDHIIVNYEEKFYSFAHNGKLKAYSNEYENFIKLKLNNS